MISFFDFLLDMTNPVLSFLPKALIIAVLAATLCGIVGTHVVLRGMAFIGDAVAHAVFPGIAIAFVLGGSLVAGGAIAGVSVAVLVAVLSQHRRIKEDALIGILFAGAFAVGVIVISTSQAYSASLSSFLFGSITGVTNWDIAVTAGIGMLVLTPLMVWHKHLTMVALDREMARAMGLPVMLLDILLYTCVAGAVVISVRTIGNVLVLALLVAPPAAARMLTDRMVPMMALAATLGGAGSFFGLYFSWALDIPTGASIVCVLTLIFIVLFLLAPRRGLLTARFQPNRAIPSSEETNLPARTTAREQAKVPAREETNVPARETARC
ncbi:anchored repeat-type ABC transporter permease subunit [Gleimia hominis]|uniref:anchored repeat-type ABC transporter permease subunit n=1 Tax=Gleimia hominis TaxID=595468 RepID=UPI000C80F315|nr:anchored repeat-type ABC transporter permease subunit [Gleimia hominis]WIK64551.1 anchored repeat-type ABC transporter permease subunit [Gleimia hominis]